MTPKQFFKLYPGAQAVWQVGNKLYFEAYENSAREQALLTGLECKRITRSEMEESKPDGKKG